MTTINLLLQFVFFILITSCSNLLYYPSSNKFIDEKKLLHPPEEISLLTNSNEELLNWYFESKKITRKAITIIFVHGNGQNISAHFRNLFWILEHDINFFIVGYPGFGPNEGNASPDSTVESVKSALKWIKINRPNDSIALFGQSLGGNVALRAASEFRETMYCAIAAEGSFLSYKKIAQNTMAKHWFTWGFQFLPYLLLSDSRAISNNLINLPTSKYLVIHSKVDQIVNYDFGLNLYNSLPEPKTLWTIADGKHIDTFFSHHEKRREFVEFIESSCLKN